MASKAHSGNILDLNARFQKNKFEDKVVQIGDVEITFAGFISSKRGSEFNRLLQSGKTVEAFASVMKTPDEKIAKAFIDAIEECTPFGDGESMQELHDHILGRGTRESDPNS